MPRSGLPPLVGPAPRILLLGSFPSQASLAAGAYYAHPRNQLWTILAEIFQSPIAAEWPERRQWLIDHALAVWDLIASCDREGSLDQNIQNAVVNDVQSLISKLPSLQAVWLNGGEAARLFDRHVPEFSRHFSEIDVQRLPSSSPVPSARYRSAADKLPAWGAALSASSRRLSD